MVREGVANMSELARRSGVPQSTLSKFETGIHQSISLEHIDRLARFFTTDPARLFSKQNDHLPNSRLQAHLMVAEQLEPTELGVLTATGDALIKSRKKAA